MVVNWKRRAPAGGDGQQNGQQGQFQYLATDEHLLTQDSRVTVVKEAGHGSTLVIALATGDDVGEYICEVSSYPPAILRHSVAIIGKNMGIRCGYNIIIDSV